MDRPEPLLSGTKLIVRVLQDLVAHQTFKQYDDLKEALKCRCARLKIPYDSKLITDAINRLEEGGRRPLIAVTRPPVASIQPEPDPIRAIDASQILADLKARFGCAIKSMPATSPADQAAHEALVRQQIQACRHETPKVKRRPFKERLDAIFNPRQPGEDD